MSVGIQEFRSVLAGYFWPSKFHEVVGTASARDAFIWRFDWDWGSASIVAQSHGCWQVASVPCHVDLCTGLLERPPSTSAGFSQSKQSRREQGSLVMDGQGGVASWLGVRLRQSKSIPGPRSSNHLFVHYTSLYVRPCTRGTMMKKKRDMVPTFSPLRAEGRQVVKKLEHSVRQLLGSPVSHALN